MSLEPRRNRLYLVAGTKRMTMNTIFQSEWWQMHNNLKQDAVGMEIQLSIKCCWCRQGFDHAHLWTALDELVQVTCRRKTQNLNNKDWSAHCRKKLLWIAIPQDKLQRGLCDVRRCIQFHLQVRRAHYQQRKIGHPRPGSTQLALSVPIMALLLQNLGEGFWSGLLSNEWLWIV